MKRVPLLWWMAMLWLLGGCSIAPIAGAVKIQGLPTPTENSFFKATTVSLSTPDIAQPSGGTPTVAQFFNHYATAMPMLIPTADPLDDLPAAGSSPTRVITSTVYTDQLNPNWSLTVAPDMQVNQAESTPVHSGSVSMAMTLHTDSSKLSFLVNQNSTAAYPRDQVIGVSFWLNSGNGPVYLNDLAVTVLGSNAYSYWVANDNSVRTDNKFFFQETMLYYLGFNRTIPPETWVHVVVYLDKLIYDPTYKYVTGFYIKDETGFLRTVYIDDVNLLTISNNTQPTNIVTHSETASPTPTVTPEPTLLTPTATPEPAATMDFLSTLTARPTYQPAATSTPKKK